jgi:UDPglucose 6-dehydrogenase
MISVFTPLVDDSITMKYIYSTLPNVTTILKNSPDAIVLIRSTVKPLVTRDYRTNLETNLGRDDIRVVFQPEFLRAKSAFEDAMNPWCVVFGISNDLEAEYLRKLIDFYSIFVTEDKVKIMSYEEAELLKLWHNTFNACKISYFNSCLLMAKAIEDKAEVKINTDYITNIMTKTCEGLMNPKYGTKTGHAYYGTCLPKDSAEMKCLEKEYNLPGGFMSSIVEINDVIKKTDKEEILDGDCHISFNQLHLISNAF